MTRSDLATQLNHLMIIGAMKCGTTSLFDYLSIHPQICPAKVKEPEFFSNEPIENCTIANYYDLFIFDKLKHKYTLEASTGYTKSPAKKNVPKKIYNAGINPKFIYIVRNPFHRIESHYNYWHLIHSPDTKLTDDHLVSVSRYYSQLEQYFGYFDKSRFLVIDFDDLIKQTNQVLDHICKFLEIENIYNNALLPCSNTNLQPISLAEKKFRSKNQDLLQLLSRCIPTKAKNLIKSKIITKLRPQKRRLNNSEYNYIHYQLIEDMRKLRDNFSINISSWGFE